MRVLPLALASKVERYSWILTLKTGNKVRVSGTYVVPSYEPTEPTVVMDKINNKEVVVYSNRAVVSVELDSTDSVQHLRKRITKE